MPYVKRGERIRYRREVSSIIDKLREESTQDRVGTFNYIISTIAVNITPKKYWYIALTIGTIICAILEFYRRIVAPYEDKKIKENGDVYPSG